MFSSVYRNEMQSEENFLTISNSNNSECKRNYSPCDSPKNFNRIKAKKSKFFKMSESK